MNHLANLSKFTVSDGQMKRRFVLFIDDIDLSAILKQNIHDFLMI